MSPKSMQKSVRPSCIGAQKPCLRSIGTFVVAIATRISTSKGYTAKLVKKPRISKNPHAISVTPTNGPENWGKGIPIF